MKKIIAGMLLLLNLFYLSPCMGATSQVSIGEFLATALNEPAISSQAEKIDFLNQSPEGIVFIEDPELRISIDQFEKDQQKYALRFTPVGFDKIHATKDLNNAMLKSNRSELDRLFHEALKSRYLTVVDYRYFSEMINLHEKIRLVFEDREAALKRYVETPDFDPEKLSGVENEQVQLEIELMELKNSQEALLSRIKEQGGYTEETVSIDVRNLITIEHIENQLSSIDMNTGSENIHILNLQTEAEMAEAEYHLKAAEEDRLISFVEAAYSTEDQDDFDKAVSIEFGISIPVRSGSQAELRKRKLASIKSKGELYARKKELNQTLPVINKDLHNLIQQYRSIKKRKEGSFTNVAFGRLVQMEGGDPFILLELKEKMLKNDILLMKLTQMIFTKYINMLDLSGKLSKKPLVNYLADQVKVIDR